MREREIRRGGDRVCSERRRNAEKKSEQKVRGITLKLILSKKEDRLKQRSVMVRGRVKMR